MNVHVTLSAGIDFDAELFANPVADDLAARLPLEAVFSDFNDVEKVASLGPPLRMRGVPDQDSPAPGEIGYYAPTQSLVLYYGTVGTWPGLVRVGRFDLALDTLRDIPDGFTARFVRVDAS
ncbi:cyclophilin-like fold protein [Microbacterium sp. NPDC079176]|uniref:cyclophilin-like fold protein n=1 Tax=Microbacterium sp. NPDC079176 TaxID=3154768 RepID=UPI0034423D23